MKKAKPNNIRQSELVPISILCRQAYDVLIQYADRPNIPQYANYTLSALRALRDAELVDCVQHPNMVKGRPDTEYTDMVLAHILDRWYGWRGSQAQHFKREVQKHLDYFNQHH